MSLMLFVAPRERNTGDSQTKAYEQRRIANDEYRGGWASWVHYRACDCKRNTHASDPKDDRET